MTAVHHLLDWEYSADKLLRLLGDGVELEARAGDCFETPLHVAARRRRLDAIETLLEHGANIDAKSGGGKTAYAHAARRGFSEIVDFLRERGADTTLNEADQLAVAIVESKLDEARAVLSSHPEAVRTGNPEEDRLLADIAGRNATAPVELLIEAGADLGATGLDGGTALHQAAWFGQPQNARLLIDAGAPLEVFDRVHESSPLGWAVHGSAYSGGADKRQGKYVEIVKALLEAGAKTVYPESPESDSYQVRLLKDASPRVRAALKKHLG